VAGRELRYEDESVEEGRRWRTALVAPDWEVDTWIGSYEAIAAGEVTRVTDTVARLTGRGALALEAYLPTR
jgi:NAD(P)H dehydrogenase (quinone)